MINNVVKDQEVNGSNPGGVKFSIRLVRDQFFRCIYVVFIVTELGFDRFELNLDFAFSTSLILVMLNVVSEDVQMPSIARNVVLYVKDLCSLNKLLKS